MRYRGASESRWSLRENAGSEEEQRKEFGSAGKQRSREEPLAALLALVYLATSTQSLQVSASLHRRVKEEQLVQSAVLVPARLCGFLLAGSFPSWPFTILQPQITSTQVTRRLLLHIRAVRVPRSRSVGLCGRNGPSNEATGGGDSVFHGAGWRGRELVERRQARWSSCRYTACRRQGLDRISCQARQDDLICFQSPCHPSHPVPMRTSQRRTAVRDRQSAYSKLQAWCICSALARRIVLAQRCPCACTSPLRQQRTPESIWVVSPFACTMD